MPGFRSNFAGFLLVLLLVAAGVVIGIALERHILHEPTPDYHWKSSASDDLERFRVQLDLSPTQAEQIGEILERVEGEIETIRGEKWPLIRAARERGRSEVLELLDEEQAEEYREMIRISDEEHRKRWGS